MTTEEFSLRRDPRQEELSNCGFVKTVLMLVIVFYHCTVFWTGSWISIKPAISSVALSYLAKWMNSFHIYGFALVSGYLFFYLRYERGKYSRYLPFLGNKAKRLLVPYVFVSLVWAIPFAVFLLQMDPSTLLSDYLLASSPQQLWFLVMLFGVFALFYPLSRFFKEHTFWGAVIALVFYGVGVLGPAFLPNVFQVFTAFRYLLFFWIGFKLRQHPCGWLRRIPAILWLPLHVLLFAAVCLLKTQEGRLFGVLELGFTLLLHAVGALMAFFLLGWIGAHVSWKNSRVMRFFERRSMPIYLFHQQLVYLCLYWLNGAMHPYLHVAFHVVAVTVGAVLLSSLVLAFGWTRVLVGEKKNNQAERNAS